MRQAKATVNHGAHISICIGLLVALSGGLCNASATADESASDGLLEAIRFTQPMSFCGEPVPLADQEVRERLEKEMLLTLWDRPQVILWLKRSNRFLPGIETMLREAGLPEDLKYLPIIESALRPHAGSPKGAVGFWQFTSSTGRRYGLRIDSFVDDRRNLHASTRAAMTYLKELHEQLGSWTLAAAAYNMGEHGLQAEILAQAQQDYYRLYLPLETQRYIFRALSAKLICSDPAAYGFRLEKEALYPPLAYDPVQVTCMEPTPIRLLAEAAGTTFKSIKDLNPQLRGHHLDVGRHQLLVPDGAAAGFQDRFAITHSRWREAVKGKIYIVQEGDNLSKIAERFKVPLPALLIWNRLDPNQLLHPGDRLVIGK
jgi:hypothetical protein